VDQFKQISTFVHVVQRGNLSAAARHEGIAPAMVSRRLDALESRLGVKLLQRTTRRVSLTAEGGAFVEHCQRILRDLEDAESAVASRSVEVTGQLRITAPVGFGRKFIAPLVARYVEAHPRINVALDLSDRIVDVLAEGFDCAIRFCDHADASLVRIPLGSSRRVVVAAPSFLARHRPRSIDDLARLPCLALTDMAGGATGSQRGWTLLENGAPTLVRIGGTLSCNDGAVLREWCLGGLGLAWRSMWEVSEDVAAGRLETVLDDLMAPPVPVVGLLPARKHLPLRVRTFIEFVKEAFQSPGVAAALGAERRGARR
jgi:DNA-binding transcriptional LysR family regulator